MTTIEKLAVAMPATWIPGPKQGQWTSEDYTSLPKDGYSYEVVNGVLYMSPAPSTGHSELERGVSRLKAIGKNRKEQLR